MKARQVIKPREVLAELSKHVLIDGFKLVLDLEKSKGCWIRDAATGKTLLDLYGGFASMPLGFNHPRFDEPEVQRDLLIAARSKVANSDVYCTLFANFVETFHRFSGLPPLERYFFIEGGALAVENALKAAMDWKVRRNLAAGKGERGTAIVHFEGAFHGRSGYTMSLTNTDPNKIAHYAKFAWPRLPTPCLDFALPLDERKEDALAKERKSEALLQDILNHQHDDIAAIIIEPIQGEGGDRHFRGEWLRTLRRMCDEYDVLLIFDEVQCGGGTTGRMWCCEHFDVHPDLLAFGKKAQTCGIMAGPRLDEELQNVFRLPGRINSTWGGNLVDMVRATHSLEIIHEERLMEHVTRTGAMMLKALEHLAEDEPIISGIRGRGFMIAFDLPTSEMRDDFHRGLFELGLLALRCGPRSIRLRPALDFPDSAVDQAIALFKKQCQRMAVPHG